MAFKQITSSFSAAPQLTQDDLAAAAKAGYRSIISSRPDGEEAGQRGRNGPNGRRPRSRVCPCPYRTGQGD